MAKQIEAWALVTKNNAILSISHTEESGKLAFNARKRFDNNARLVHLVEDEDEKAEGR